MENELLTALKRLMEFRAENLRTLGKSYDDGQHPSAYARDYTMMHMLRLLNNPVWHRLEELLK